ncbi:MAG: hypothetical protein GY906_22800 [bacterium]|nr:hypothetical protein [bacterium]
MPCYNKDRGYSPNDDDDDDDDEEKLSVDVWEERGYLTIRLFKGDKQVARWDDDEAFDMFRDGFFVHKSYGPKGEAELKESVAEYARSVGLI